MILILPQIEKFIESIFPTQNAEEAQRRMKGELTAEEAKKQAEDAENRSDMYMIMGLMGGMVFIIAAVMVWTALSPLVLTRLTRS